MNALEQLRLAHSATLMLVAELRDGGCDPSVIAAALCKTSGSLYREDMPSGNYDDVIKYRDRFSFLVESI